MNCFKQEEKNHALTVIEGSRVLLSIDNKKGALKQLANLSGVSMIGKTREM